MKDLGTPKSRRKAGKEKQSSPAARKKMKSPAKLTPKKRAFKSSTPKRIFSVTKKKGSDVVSSGSVRRIDSWFQTKLSAEGDSGMIAGSKIHPYFSLWKAEKKTQEQERRLSAARRERGGVIGGPIHVFENVQDDASPLDWSGWTFLGKTNIEDFGPESSILSVLEGSVESLNLDNFSSVLKPSSASTSQSAMSCPSQLSIQPDSMLEISPPNSAVLANEQVICPSKPEDAKVDLDFEENEVNTFLGHKGIFRKSDTEPLSKFLQESMRSYYHSCEGKAEGSLWIHKYKPIKAFEVCGNKEAMNFINDWLHLWHEKNCPCRKDSSNKDHSNRQDDDDDYICSDSEYISEDINEEDSLQNVLLITGPIG
ncbi:hypothetical protein CR513_33515, partial [Mucuna pruriens]